VLRSRPLKRGDDCKFIKVFSSQINYFFAQIVFLLANQKYYLMSSLPNDPHVSPYSKEKEYMLEFRSQTEENKG